MFNHEGYLVTALLKYVFFLCLFPVHPVVIPKPAYTFLFFFPFLSFHLHKLTCNVIHKCNLKPQSFVIGGIQQIKYESPCDQGQSLTTVPRVALLDLPSFILQNNIADISYGLCRIATDTVVTLSLSCHGHLHYQNTGVFPQVVDMAISSAPVLTGERSQVNGRQ